MSIFCLEPLLQFEWIEINKWSKISLWTKPLTLSLSVSEDVRREIRISLMVFRWNSFQMLRKAKTGESSLRQGWGELWTFFSAKPLQFKWFLSRRQIDQNPNGPVALSLLPRAALLFKSNHADWNWAWFSSYPLLTICTIQLVVSKQSYVRYICDHLCQPLMYLMVPFFLPEKNINFYC